MYYQPITIKVKDGVIKIPQPFLQHIPEEGQCDIEMISDNVIVIVFKKPDNCFSKLKSIEHFLELSEDKLLYAREKVTLLTQLQQEIQELWKLSVGRGKYFEQCVIMMKVALKRIEPEAFNLTHLKLFLDIIRRLQQKEITKNDVQRYDQLFAANQMDVMLKLGEDVTQSYLEER